MSQTTIINILAVLAAAGVGGFLGAYLADYFTERRDRKNRKRNFRGFLAEWRAIVEQTTRRGAISTHYFEHVRAFRKEAERVRGDFADEEAFSERVQALGHMTPNELEGDPSKESRDILADEIEKFLNFIRQDSDLEMPRRFLRPPRWIQQKPRARTHSAS